MWRLPWESRFGMVSGSDSLIFAAGNSSHVF